ncbi:uncharacterized protein LOC132565275 [Ylistrum balloti]|uniref:uncharacterized protein LOC132565275 n=1 Tax=Ylistrum balloti TaxID=509963 RepID=UPI002905E4C8|nr:uncharacterized protein LOC132565275 [Ylistrum balloti]
MGCNNSKVEEHTHQEQNKNKIEPVNVPVKGKSVSSLDSITANIVRKTEQTVLMQLKDEGVVPVKGEGGVAFVLNIDGLSEPDPLFSTLPGVPVHNRDQSQYATYSREAFRSKSHAPPRRLPPINRSKASIDAKLERARLNRERKIAERKEKWAKKYARIESTMQKKSQSVE